MLRLLLFFVLAFSHALAVVQSMDVSPSKLETRAHVFLKEFCLDCHGADAQEGGVRLDSVQYDLTVAENINLWDRVLTQVQIHDMPPSDAGQPDQKLSLIHI